MVVIYQAFFASGHKNVEHCPEIKTHPEKLVLGGIMPKSLEFSNVQNRKQQFTLLGC